MNSTERYHTIGSGKDKCKRCKKIILDKEPCILYLAKTKPPNFRKIWICKNCDDKKLIEDIAAIERGKL